MTRRHWLGSPAALLCCMLAAVAGLAAGETPACKLCLFVVKCFGRACRSTSCKALGHERLAHIHARKF